MSRGRRSEVRSQKSEVKGRRAQSRAVPQMFAGEQRVKAIIPVHFGGHACEIDDILSMAEEYGWKVMEDAAHALPTYYRTRENEKVRSGEGKKIRESGPQITQIGAD